MWSALADSLSQFSAFSWLEKFTPKDVWLGGFTDKDGQEHFSEEGLKRVLSDYFDLLEVQDIPLVIREHRRKYQYIVSQAMVWRRRSQPSLEIA